MEHLNISRYRSFAVYSLIVSLLFVANPVFAQNEDSCAFNRNLSVGMTGADVRNLQQLLNKSSVTRVSEAGPGSPGQETTYFGVKTRLAVIRFQEQFRAEVLTPVGLTSGSGFVGAFSRAKLLAECATLSSGSANPPMVTTPPEAIVTATPPPAAPIAIPVSPSLAETTVASMSGFKSDTPVLMYISTNAAPRGATVKLSALGMAQAGNVVMIDALAIPTTTIEKDGTLSFVVPADAPRGTHEIWFTNSKGVSNKRFFIVTDPALPSPTITSVTPTEGFYGTTVTVTGTGFLPTANTVRISYANLTNIASPDGTTLQFTVAPADMGLKVGEDRPGDERSVPFWFRVSNNNGISSSSIFYLKI